MIFLQLFYEFFKTGLFAVGGGLATLPFLEDISQRTGWFTSAQLADMLAISESTPGPIGVNMATYVGFETAGILGALCATVGLVMPSVILIVLVSKVLEKFRSNTYVEAAFYGLRPASVAMVASAGIGVAMTTLLNLTASGFGVLRWRELVLAVVILVLTNFVPKVKKFHPIVFIALAAAVGIIFKFLGGKISCSYWRNAIFAVAIFSTVVYHYRDMYFCIF